MTETNIPNENEPQDLNTPSPQQTETPLTGGGRIIQPITENLVIDPLPSKPQTVALPLATHPTEATDTSAEDIPLGPITPSTPYTYTPDAANSGIPDSVVAIDKTAKDNQTSKKIIIWITALGVFIILASLYSLVVGIMSALKYPSASGSFGVIVSLGQLLLGIGILKRHGLARSIYVVLAVISLLFTIYPTFIFLNSGTQSYQQSEWIVENANTQADKLTIQYQNDKSLSETQKKEKIEAVKEAQKEYQQAFANNTTKTIASIILLWATSLIPLIFLTRKRVKQEFS